LSPLLIAAGDISGAAIVSLCSSSSIAVDVGDFGFLFSLSPPLRCSFDLCFLLLFFFLSRSPLAPDDAPSATKGVDATLSLSFRLLFFFLSLSLSYHAAKRPYII
jgi:hypothetical protein